MRANITETASKMNTEIRAVAGYRALIISKYTLSGGLILSALFVGFLGYPFSPFYIFLLLNVLPPILSFAFKDYANKYHIRILAVICEEAPFLLSNVKRKYRYSRTGYVSNSISFLFALFLLILWQYNCSTTPGMNRAIIYQPLILMVLGVLVRFTGLIIYRIKLPLDVANNRI